jgi:hypothetical protein
VSLRVDPTLATPSASKNPLPVEGHIVDVDGVSTGSILVFVGNGCLGSLEIYGSQESPMLSGRSMRSGAYVGASAPARSLDYEPEVSGPVVEAHRAGEAASRAPVRPWR